MRGRYLSFICLIFAVIANADAFGAVKASGTCGDDVRWMLNDDGLMTISGTGWINYGVMYEEEDWVHVNRPWESFRQDIVDLVIEEGITAIPIGCFLNSYALRTIKLPSTIEFIEKYAFENCSSLKKVEVSGGMGHVCDDAFLNCNSIEEVSTSDLKKWCESSFDYYPYDEVPVLDENGNEVWVWINPDEEKLFSYTYRIASNPLVYSKCLTVNGTKLTEIVIPDGVETLGSCVFAGCEYIRRVVFPSSVKTVGPGAFDGCVRLMECETKDIKAWSSIDFERIECPAYYAYYSDYDEEDVVYYSFHYGPEFFYTSNPLTICNNLIYNGNLVKNVTIAEGTAKLGKSAFNGYTPLESVDIPASVTNFPPSIFMRCTGLKDVKVHWSRPYYFTREPGVGDPGYSPDPFLGVSLKDVTLHVPQGTASDYLERNVWKDFGNIVEFGLTDIVSGTCGDNLTWTLDDEGLLKIEGTGPMYDYSISGDGTNVPWGDNKDLIVSVEISENVTHIGKYAFFACDNLETVTLPNSITSIGQAAFALCNALTSVTIPNSVTNIESMTFNRCYNLESVIIPNSVTEIGRWAFRSCTSLASINIPNSVTSIGEQAFESCSGLTSVNIPNSVTSIAQNAFWNCTGLPIIDNIRYADTFLVDVVDKTCVSANIKPGTKWIGYDAFGDCSSLSSVSIPNSMIEIGSAAFSGCSALKSVIIPDSVTVIKDSAFGGCTSLTSVVIGSSVSSIITFAFGGCSKLAEVYNKATEPQTIDGYVFDTYGTLYVPKGSVEAYRQAENWKNFTIVEMSAFPCYINGLAYDYTDESQTAVRVKAIDKKMTDIVIPSEVYELPVVEIESEAFANCVNLVNVVIPSSIRTIGDNIFPGCGSLASIVWNPNMKLPVSAMNGVDNPNLLLYVAVKIHAPSNVKNVVVNGAAEEITLVDATGNNNFYVPQVFTAKHISYSHNYTQQTIIGSCAGWETIALPFDVQSITHSRNGIIAPFAANNTAAKPFWLYSLGEVGFTASSDIKANTPYIISMPNNDAYSDEYIQSGVVTFSAENLSVPKTEAKKSVKGNVEFIPTTLSLTKNSEVYAINKGEMYDGQLAGSVFVSNLRDVSPFEAYLTLSGNMAKACIDLMDLGFDDDTSGIAVPIKSSGMKIWSENGTLYISTDKENTVRIYTASGMLVRIADIHEGLNAIETLPSGAYIVENKKVVVY